MGATSNRPLTNEERQLVRWMLENATPAATEFLPQLDIAAVTPWKCPCGCASFNLSTAGCEAPSGKMQVVADFVFGGQEDLCGIFAFERGGTLEGIEVYGLAIDAPKELPKPESLRPFRAGSV